MSRCALYERLALRLSVESYPTTRVESRDTTVSRVHACADFVRCAGAALTFMLVLLVGPLQPVLLVGPLQPVLLVGPL